MNSHTHKPDMEHNPYTRFLLMLAVSFVVMYAVMYLNTYQPDQIYFSLTRFYMTCLMISTMAVIMLLFMKKMYGSKQNNRLILGGSAVLFFAALFLVRAQVPIKDVLWMRAMIPHHSIAILTSERADIQDPEVRKLADDIIKAQKKEIGQMKQLIKKLENEKK
ncbi:DUF305 domain-containing protein [Kaistella palustris]|uniref:DUF305 domain-containing protein n=1 Tax=Kaistella palustris TaxID=493376 RepID=UPI0004288EFB|nr:DUF305 domain-containing protein [Kaistella palustris]